MTSSQPQKTTIRSNKVPEAETEQIKMMVSAALANAKQKTHSMNTELREQYPVMGFLILLFFIFCSYRQL